MRNAEVDKLIAAMNAVVSLLEAPLTESDRRAHWEDESRRSWLDYMRQIRAALIAVSQGREEWNEKLADSLRVRHIARGLNNDGLDEGELADQLIGLQRLLTEVYSLRRK